MVWCSSTDVLLIAHTAVQTTNKQTKEYGQSRTLEPRSRASEKEDSITHSGRAGLSLPRLASGAHRWSAPPRAALTLGVVRSMSVPHCALGAAGDPGVPLPWLSSSFLAARVARVCESRELPPARRHVSLSAIAPRALGLVPGQRTVAPPRGVAAAVAAQPGCRSRSRVPPDRGADAEGDVEFGLCGTPPQEHLPFTMRGVAFAALRPSLPGGSLRRTSTGWGCLLLSTELGAGKRRVAGGFPPIGFDMVFRAHAGHAIRAHAGHANRPMCSVIGRRALAVAATPPSSFLAPPSPWRRRQPC